jgi:hypothetical protein
MVMSQLSKPIEETGLGIDVIRGLKSTILGVVSVIHARRQEQARHVVRSIIARYPSDEDLASYGWSADDIRRLRSL